MVQLLDSGEAKVVLESLAIQRNDCQKLQHNVHFAAEANYVTHSAGLKTSCSHGQHKRIHRLANLVKHEHGSRLAGVSDVRCHLPPPPPPHYFLPIGITCQAVEKSMQAKVKVQYIVVEVSIASTECVASLPAVYRDTGSQVYSQPCECALMDEESLVFPLYEPDIQDTLPIRSALVDEDTLRIRAAWCDGASRTINTVPSSQQYTEPEAEMEFSPDGPQEPTIYKNPSNLKVMVLSAPDVTASTANFIFPGQHFSAMARLTRQDRTYFELPCAAGYIPLHSRKDVSKIVVDQACGKVADLNPE